MTYITEILLLVFLVITFLQSAIDKMLDWNGNLSWLKDHFSKTFMKNMVPMNLAIILVLELVAGVLCAVGAFQLYTSGEKHLALNGAVLSCVALLMLLFGQRVAKDYDGARTIVIYLMPAIFAVYLLTR